MPSIIRAKFSIETQRMAKYRPPSGILELDFSPFSRSLLLSILHEGEIIGIGRIPRIKDLECFRSCPENVNTMHEETYDLCFSAQFRRYQPVVGSAPEAWKDTNIWSPGIGSPLCGTAVLVIDRHTGLLALKTINDLGAKALG